MSNDNGNKSGTLTGNATVDILQRKVTLKKELIHLRKLKIQEDRQVHYRIKSKSMIMYSNNID